MKQCIHSNKTYYSWGGLYPNDFERRELFLEIDLHMGRFSQRSFGQRLLHNGKPFCDFHGEGVFSKMGKGLK